MYPAPVLYPVRRSFWSSSSFGPSPPRTLPTLPSKTLNQRHPSPSPYPHTIEPAAQSVKHARSATMNRLIFRAPAFTPHDGDGDQWRRPQLEHEPAGFPCAFGVHARTFCLALNLSIPSLSVPFKAITTSMLAYIHVIIEFMSHPEYGDLIPMFGIVNEGVYHLQPHDSDTDPSLHPASLASDATTDTTTQLPRMIGGITGNGPFTSIHDGSEGTTWWMGFPQLGRHHLRHASIFCPEHGLRDRRGEFGNEYVLDGCEWDATLWHRLPGIARREHMERAGVKQLALAPMDTMRDWFFFMKKIGPALDGSMPSALLSYQFGLQTGFMPTNPRHSIGICGQHGRGDDRLHGRPVACIACLTFMTLVAGCTYPDTWKAIGSPVPAGVHRDAVTRLAHIYILHLPPRA
ncbi:hypothetical protein DFH08DRAFT_1078414 [Mycena albidolilacea]|uniref:Uncharacterized protein n=1 Tax=Mycena albidolilacea TaxID=1033008 RepID=A0AAD7EW31_9AGAR|nr:hypothetical protein DFH08DRAFT_1078414 [Mycena albidolilacea]